MFKKINTVSETVAHMLKSMDKNSVAQYDHNLLSMVYTEVQMKGLIIQNHKLSSKEENTRILDLLDGSTLFTKSYTNYMGRSVRVFTLK